MEGEWPAWLCWVQAHATDHNRAAIPPYSYSTTESTQLCIDDNCKYLLFQLDQLGSGAWGA